MGRVAWTPSGVRRPTSMPSNMGLPPCASPGYQYAYPNFLSLPSPISPLFSPPNPNNKCWSHLTTSPNTSVNEFDQKSLQISSPSTTTTTTRVQNTSKSSSYSARRAAIVDVQQAPNLDSALSRFGAMLQVQDLNVILRHFGKLNRWQDVSKLFDWMKKRGKINIASYSSFIKFMGKSRNPIKALETYNSIQDESTRNNVSVCNSILGCLIRNGKFESSIKLFDQMKQSGLTPDAVTYSTLLSGCMKGKHGYSKAMQLVQELKQNGLNMDTVIYGSLLAICASNNRSEDAEAFFQQMKDEGYSPNEFHYSSLLNAYSVEGNHSKADELVKDMKSAGLVPNKVFLTTLIKVYVRGGLFEKARELLVELEPLGYAEDEMPYCLLMDGLAKAGHIDEAKSVFDEMETRDVKSDGYSHSIMISAFCRSGHLEEAKQLARDFEARYDKYDLVMLNTLLRAYCRGGEMESVMQMLRKMDELTISPDSNTFHILIKYYCKEKLYQLAYRTMVDMHHKGHQLDEELGSSLILHLGKVGASSEAFSVYNMLRYSKRTLCRALHGKMLNILVAGGLLKDAYVVVKDNAEQISRTSLKKFAISFMKSGNINLINDVVKVLHSSRYKIDQEVFGMAISRYIGEPEKKDLLLQLLQWMTGQGYVVDSSSRNLILKNSHLFGRHLIADILSKQHRMSKVSKTQEMKG
ncbi:Pentatricopeptide repeat [Macleaya cordata]|uniref:Pentatricopeptide repeat n=1 Tax=Macleaya cordata TaxID=56857 RepID=A0A200PZW6_MACCD|nr:Pentatricopeptide repeat [Macleaya cordata]